MSRKVEFGNLNMNIDTRPKVVSIVHGTSDECEKLAEAGVAAGADILEFRADTCVSSTANRHDAEELVALLDRLSAHQKPLLLTIRKQSEGGEFAGSEPDRLQLFRDLIPHADAVDIELHATEIQRKVILEARQNGKFVVASYHNFEKTPPFVQTKPNSESLESILAAALRLKVDLLKIAVTANTEEDRERLLEFTVKHVQSLSLSTISMGEHGSISRILNPFVGSRLTYGYVAAATVIGQLHVRNLNRAMQWVPMGGTNIAEAKRILRLIQSEMEVDQSEILELTR